MTSCFNVKEFSKQKLFVLNAKSKLSNDDRLGPTTKFIISGRDCTFTELSRNYWNVLLLNVVKSFAICNSIVSIHFLYSARRLYQYNEDDIRINFELYQTV